MRVLIVSATPSEIAPIVAQLRPTSERSQAARGESLAAFDGRCIPADCVAPRSNTPGILGRRALPTGRLARLGATPDFHHGPQRVTAYSRAGHDVDVLITGVGMVATAAWCSRTLALTPYDLALNLGVCGSFDRALEPGRVVHVVADRIAELGAEDDDAFLTIQHLNLLGDDECPFTGGQLVNLTPPANAGLGSLPAVRGITVNTVHGNEQSIAAVVRRFAPQVESMEGAAFMYACLIHGLAFAQVRAVSNVVEKRNRDAWQMTDAITSLGVAALNILDGL